ncbi:WD40 repeat protein [Spironucleus salmonicida]|uniref:WD40 repeat protein n=1 Tax=Spironucleus salmonicida TaxID=348837 RepID=V6LM86_9EUKA|nr:WD40 repeat protein [Spironucleus salmonicida]|eukprot:EST41829.1 hypothetical protein SS50377_18663 [Spironucleus salmonicida]
MHIQFSIKSSQHNNRTPLLKISPIDDIVAVASNASVIVYSADGGKIEQIDTQNHPVLDIAWSSDGSYLAVLAQNSNIVYLWMALHKRQTKLTLDVSDPICIDWSYSTKQLAIGTAQGHMFTYDAFSSARVPFMSKHQKRLYSICYTHTSDHIVTISPESLNVSTSSGETIGYLRQKSLGCIFLGRIVACQIKGPSQLFDAVCVPVYLNAALSKKAKNEIYPNASSIFLLILNVDKAVLGGGEAKDIYQLLKEGKNGYYATELWTQNDADTLLDLQYMPGTETNPPQLVSLLSSGNIFNTLLDHSRQEMNVVMQGEGKYKYGTIVSRRSAECVQNCYAQFLSYLEEINNQYGIVENTNGNQQFNLVVSRSLCPSRSISILQVIKNSSKFLVPFDKSINIIDVSSGSNIEKTYMDFTGGKNSLGVVSNYPTNIVFSNTSNAISMLSFSNGSTMLLLTKSVSVHLKQTIEGCIPQPTSFTTENYLSCKYQGMHIINQISPKQLLIQKVIPCQFSTPVISQFANEISLPQEAQKLAISSEAFGYVNGNNITWSSISHDENYNLNLAFRTAQQLNIQQFQLISVNSYQVAAIKTSDGGVAMHAGGGVSVIVDFQGNKIQQIKCCSPLLFTLSDKSLLQVYNIDVDDDKIYYNLVSQQQMSNQFNSQTNSSDVELEIMPGGAAVMIYKKNTLCNPQVYLPAEEILLDDIFRQQIALSQVLFDTSLLGVFAAFNSTSKGDQLFANEVFTGAVAFSVADYEGPTVLFSKSSVQSRETMALPNILSNGISYTISSKIEESDPIPGLANIHQALTSIQLPSNQSQQTYNFINYVNPITQIQTQNVSILPTDNQVSIQLLNHSPEFKKMPHPSQIIIFSRAACELCNLGQTTLALHFAVRLYNVALLKIVGDSALRFGDTETAQCAFNELSLMQQVYEKYDDEIKQLQAFFEGKQQSEIFSSLQICQFQQNLQNNFEPAAISLFISRICAEETDVSTSLAYSLLISTPDMEKHPKDAEKTLDMAERLLLRSNKPSLALSFRVDSLDWATASDLAKKISSPYVRAEILIQQAGELESKNLYQEAAEICLQIAKSPNQKDARVELSSVPAHVQPLFIGVLSRCYVNQGKISECRDLALPPKIKERYQYRPRDPLNILQRVRLCYECGDILFAQKRYVDAANFFEAAAQLIATCFNKLNKEINMLNTAEVSLYEIVFGSAAENMLLFQLVQGLKIKCQINYELMVNDKSDQYDIQLLQQLDKDETENQKKAQAASLPQKLGDIVAKTDLNELDAGSLLSKAANCYIKGRQFENAEALIEYVTDKNTIADLARVFMRDNPEKALNLFKRAGKSLEIVECLLSLKKVPEAESAVREVKVQLDKLVAGKTLGSEALIMDMENEFRQSSLLLANFFKRANASKKAVYYYIMGENYDEAYELAIATKNEDILIKYVTNKAPSEFLKKAAKYFASPDPDSQEKKPRNMTAAAKFLELSGAVDNAIKLLLNYGDGSSDIDKAIDLLKNCKNMVDYVLKYLQGGSDGVKKNPIFIFKLYLALDRHQDAAKTAYILADREIENQRFNRAKSILLTCMNKLKQATGKVPQKFRQQLILMHAVDVGRKFAKLGLHQQAGTCLYRAARVASRFNESASNILISACVECSRAGPTMLLEAYQCACVLLKEYQDEIPDKYRKPIELIVRKHKKDQIQENVSLNCCQCQSEVKAGKLECDSCQAVLPLDAATGNQMTLSDYCECPYCNWQCSRLGLYEIYSQDEIKAYDTTCLMCNQVFDLKDCLVVDNSNYQLISNGKMNYDHYENRPLIIFEDSNLARKRYEEWVKIWYAEEIKETNTTEKQE